MALTHLVDTSVLKRLGRPAVRAVIEPLTAAGRLGRPRICDLEVGYSARSEAEWDQLVTALDAFDPVETTAAHVQRALQVQRLLARRSQRGRKIPDLLVAAAAEALDIAVLHYEADFDLIAAVTGQRCSGGRRRKCGVGPQPDGPGVPGSTTRGRGAGRRGVVPST